MLLFYMFKITRTLNLMVCMFKTPILDLLGPVPLLRSFICHGYDTNKFEFISSTG